jgi:ribosome-associated heat shock protein Hsp15
LKQARSDRAAVPATQFVRLDKWLWAVRLFHSRSEATAACAAGHVRIAGARVKPAREIRVGETLSVLAGGVQRTVRVLALLDQRVGAKLVMQFMEDHTTPEEFARAREARRQNTIMFPQGFGRPTKKQRRQLDQLEF